jgi:hypothetical protein
MMMMIDVFSYEIHQQLEIKEYEVNFAIFRFS